MSDNQQYELITHNTNLINSESLKEKLNIPNTIQIYWGISMTDEPDITYIYNFVKIRDFLNAGCKVIILLADLHAYLESKKKNWKIIEEKVKYYKELSIKILKLLNVDISNLFFIRGSKFQLSIDYTIKYFDLLHRVKIEDALESVKDIIIDDKLDNQTISKLVYPVLQLADEYYLNIDAEFGNYKQEKIFNLGHKIGRDKDNKNKTTYLLGPELNNFNIKLNDKKEIILQKINKFYFPKDDVNNSLFLYIKYVVFSVKRNIFIRTKYSNETYIVDNYEQLHNLFVDKLIKPVDIKNIVSDFLIEFLKNLLI